MKPTKTKMCRSVWKLEATYPFTGKKSRGNLHAVSVARIFPAPEPREEPFVEPAGFPLSTRFGEWFEYFVQRIGAAVEKLNAWQFNMRRLPPGSPAKHPLARKFARELDRLAKDMGIGAKGSHNPRKLQWPLHGVYVCDLLLQVSEPTQRRRRAVRTEPARVLLVTSFESDPDYKVVTHCSVVLIEPSKKDKYKAAALPPIVNWDSSSSSSLGTGSSSSSVRNP